VIDVLRKMTVVALALSLFFAQAAVAQPGHGGPPKGNAGGHGKGFSDGR
jgi:hypothetical protein